MSATTELDASHYRRLLMDRVPSMLAYWDADLRCRFANQAYVRWFGVSPSDLVGRSLRDLLGPELFTLNEPYVRAVLAGQDQTFERVVPGPDGVRRDSLAHYTPDIVDGVVVGFLVEVTDVTPLKAAQLELLHSQEYLRELFSLTTEGVVVADREGRYIDCNDASCTMLGYSRQEILGKTFEDLLCTAELQRLPAARALLHAGQLHVEEWALRRKDGGTIPVEVRASFLPDGRRVGYLRDITEYKRMLAAERETAAELERRVEQRTADLQRAHRELQGSHKALQASEDRYHTLVNWSPEAIAVHRHGHLVYVNRSAVKLFGATSESELLGKAILDLIRPESRGFVQERVTSAAEQGIPGELAEVALFRLDGTPIEAEVQGIPIEFGGEAALLASIRDITDRKQAERELQAGKAKLEAALSSMSDAMVICDTQGRLIELNDAFATFHRFNTKGECLRTLAEYPKIFEVFLSTGKPAPLDEWPPSKALRGESGTNVEYGLRRKDTGQSWAGSYSYAPTRSQEGAITGAVVTARDVTEAKRKQAELESAHADLLGLIAANDRVQGEERKRIARDLHDDLQQTLTAIRIDVGVAGQMVAQSPSAVAPMLAKVDELAASAIVSARRIVNDLQPQMLEDLGLVPALDTLVTQFSRRTGISCQLEVGALAADALPASSSAATPLYRIAQEALNNVIKHAQASAVHVRLETSPGGNLVLRISDNGKGMTVAERRKAQSFGLLGMQERARALGGALRIESRLSVGTTIEVSVPLPVTPASAPQAEAGLEPVSDMSDAAPSTQEEIDALPGNIAVLDAQGVIRFVNQAWSEFAQRNGNPGMIAVGPGVDYLAVCRRVAQEDEHAEQALKGLLAVLDGTRVEAVTAYPCHSPDEQRWFLVRVVPSAGGNIQVTHFDVSHRVDAMRNSRPAVQKKPGGT